MLSVNLELYFGIVDQLGIPLHNRPTLLRQSYIDRLPISQHNIRTLNTTYYHGTISLAISHKSQTRFCYGLYLVKRTYPGPEFQLATSSNAIYPYITIVVPAQLPLRLFLFLGLPQSPS
jgi:hypothetical protein